MKLIAQKEFFWVCPITEQLVRIIGVGQENMTLVEGTEKALLFDTGTGYGNIGELVRQMTDKPLYVVFSHGHPDHIGGACCFDEAYVHPADLEMASQPLSDEERLSCTDYLSMQTRLAHVEDLDAAKLAPWKQPKLIPVTAGHEFDLGGGTVMKVEVLPGHTAGSIVLVNEKDRYVLTGDSVTRETLLGLPGGPSKETYRDALKSFIAKYRGKIDLVMPGHGGALPDTFGVMEGNLDAIEGLLSGKYQGYPDPRHRRLGKNVNRTKPELGSAPFSVGLEGFCTDGTIGNVLYSVEEG